MPRQYRVITVNANSTISALTDWQSYRQCRKCIIGRWGYWPGWAYISSAGLGTLEKRYLSRG